MKITKEQLLKAVKENKFFDLEEIDNVLNTFNDLTDSINNMIASGTTEATNLKAYNLSYQIGLLDLSDHEKEMLFDDICSSEYQFFIDFIEKDNIEREYIGGTSSFKYVANVGDYHHEEIFNGETYEIEDFAYRLPFMESLILLVAEHQDIEKDINDAMDYVQREIDKTYDPTDDDLHEIVNDSFDDLIQSLHEEVACLEDVHDSMKDIKEAKEYIHEWQSERNAIELIEAYK